MAKQPKGAPTQIGQKVKLRGRSTYGEIVAWIKGDDYEWVTVAWDWESYMQEPPVKGMAWGYITPQELELVSTTPHERM